MIVITMCSREMASSRGSTVHLEQLSSKLGPFNDKYGSILRENSIHT